MLHPYQAGAAGFTIYEIATADLGLASAGYSARAEDPSTVLTNPAGITRLEGTQMLFGAQPAYGDATFSASEVPNRPSGGNGGTAIGFVPALSGFASRKYSQDVSFGIGLGSNFGGQVKYDDDWTGRYYSQRATILGLSLFPAVAYRANDRISIGVTLNVMYGILQDHVGVNNFAPGYGDGQLRLDNDAVGYGAIFGLLYTIDDAMRLGFTYKTKITLKFSPRAEFIGVAPGLSNVLQNRGLLTARVNLGVAVPQALEVSLYRKLSDQVTVLTSLGWEQWSKFGDASVGVESSNPRSLTAPIDYKDAGHVAIGLQYRPGGQVQYSFGVAYDSKFQNGDDVALAIPTNDQLRFGFGAEVKQSDRFTWGIATEYLYGGSLGVNKQSILPVAFGGRGNVVGTFGHTDLFFLAIHGTWRL